MEIKPNTEEELERRKFVKIALICVPILVLVAVILALLDTSPKGRHDWGSNDPEYDSWVESEDVRAGRERDEERREAYRANNISVQSTQQSTKETRRDKIKKLFSVWNGSHRASVELIKELMHNPDSFEHVSTDRYDEGDHILVITTYRGTNVYGGVVKNTLRTEIDLDGNIIGVGE